MATEPRRLRVDLPQSRRRRDVPVNAQLVICVSVALWRILLLCVLCVSVACRQDMHNQPKYIPLRESTFFADLRSARPLVPGTVARGQLREDSLLFTGKTNGADATVFPFPIDAAVMVRGQERFNIYCSPC